MTLVVPPSAITCSRSPHGLRGLKYHFGCSLVNGPRGRSPHGLRGLKWRYSAAHQRFCCCRSPHGLRGLKCPGAERLNAFLLSQPSWAAWIEISALWQTAAPGCSRSPHGLRGLKLFPAPDVFNNIRCRSPHGLRGLKYLSGGHNQQKLLSQPSWAAWIEISLRSAAPACSASQPSWAAWIEIL